MDLLAKSIIAVVVVLLIIAVVYYLIMHFAVSQHVSEAEAISLIISDIKNSNPSAIVNVTNASPSQYPGSWHVVVSVVLNATSPCPNFYIYSYDYPKYGFVPRTENNYTSNCVVHGFSNSSNYIFASYPAAITRVYSFPAAQAYINKFGFSNISTSAILLKNVTINGERFSNVWAVTYTSPRANYTERFFITQVGGNLIANYSLPK